MDISHMFSETCETFSTVQNSFNYVSVLSKKGQTVSPILKQGVRWMFVRDIPALVKKSFRGARGEGTRMKIVGATKGYGGILPRNLLFFRRHFLER